MLCAFGHRVAMCCNMLGVVGSNLKPGPNDRNLWKQQIATLLSAICCTRLATLLRRVATCCELKIELVRMWYPQMLHGKFDHFQIWANNTQHVATSRNRVAKRTQHVAPNNVTIFCVEMLWSFGRGLTMVKFEPTTPNMLQHIPIRAPNARNNVAICCVGMLRSFARGFRSLVSECVGKLLNSLS